VAHPSASPVIRVNRLTCHFKQYRTPRRPHASWVSHHPPQVNVLTLAHLAHPPSLPAVCSTNRVMSCGSIVRSWPARPKCAPMTVLFLGGAAHDGEPTLNITLSLLSLSHLLVSFSPFCNLSPCPLCVDRGRFSSHPLLFRFYVSLLLSTAARTSSQI
jgi:hypothetical protein